MEIDNPRTFRTINSIILLAALSLIAAGLVLLTVLTTQAASNVEDADLQKQLARLAWIATVLLGLTLVLLLWAVMRLVRSRMNLGQRHPPTPYVDAWALAGQRMQVPDDDDEEDVEIEDED